MLVLTGGGVVFFTVSSIRMCFGFVLNMELIIQKLFFFFFIAEQGGIAEPRPYLLFMLVRRLGVAGAQPGQVIPN